MTLEVSAPAALPDRTRWHLAANAPVAAWLAALLGITVFDLVPQTPWLIVHLLVLGAVTNAIFVWSAHFADALLRRRATTESRRWQACRLVILNVGVIAVVTGMVGGAWFVTLAGSVIVGAAASAHAVTLALQARKALASRFGATVHYYICASLALPLGALLGAMLAGHPVELWHSRLAIAHIALNLFGWIGLTVMGTMVTLWPTMLRTRIAPGAERVARQALPILVSSVVVTVTGAMGGWQTIAALGVAGYLAGVLWAARPLVRVARTKAPSAYATWSVMAAVIWLVGSLAGLVAVLAGSPTWELIHERLELLVTPMAAGFAAQVLLGALSFLVPVVLGGGPAAVRGTQARMDRGGALRTVLINAGLVIYVLPVPPLVRSLVSVLVLGAFAAFLPLLVTSVRYALRAKRAARQESADITPLTRHVPEPVAVLRGRSTGQAAVAVAAVVLAVAGGVALDPAALNRDVSAASEVVATGHVTRVSVIAAKMRFMPASMDVPAGNRLVVVLTNEDADLHDLTLETGQITTRITRGGTTRLDVDVVGSNLKGWCTIVGHREAGMVFAVNVVKAPNASHPPSGSHTH
jgi:nitrite reductase (NO-forming)